MSRGRKCGLSREDEALWRQVASTATPLHPAKRALNPQPATLRPNTSEPRALTPFEVGSKRPETRIRSSVDLAKPQAPPQSLNIDRKAAARLKRGKTKPDARIDLHGMTLDEAHAALTAYLFRQQNLERRLVLVITGKGSRETPPDLVLERRGALRRQVPFWLETPPLSAIVSQFSQAHQRHGGEGAYYVYLKRRR